MRSKLKLLLVFGLINNGLFSYQFSADPDSAQNQHIFSIQQSAVISGKRELPFWLISNNSSRLDNHSYLGYLNSLSLEKEASLGKSKSRYFYAVEANTFVGSQTRFSLTQAYLGVKTKFVNVRLGAKEENFGLNDSTLSIGNLFYGNNARPIPKLVFSSPGWTKSPILGRFLSFKAYLAHGWFEKDRYQSKALLHQKYLYFRSEFLKKRIQITAGLHHSAQWSGSNEEKGISQPTSLSDFTRIFFAMSGKENANLSDQINALGNHLGTYDLSASINFRQFTISNYWQFLWEDKSGLTPFNWRDGLMGLSIKSKMKTGLIYGMNIEIIRTTSQDASKYDDEGNLFLEPDDFFNNSIYRSAWTYQKRSISSPVFLILNPTAISGSIVKNVVNGYNIGIEGGYKTLTYRLNFRHFRNGGTIFERFNPSLELSSVLAYLQMPLKTGEIRLMGVLEWGNYLGKNAGLILSYSHRLKF